MSRPGRVAWVAVLALPALAFGARLLLRAHDEDQRATPERARSGTALGPTIWTAAQELAELGRVDAQIAPLHADPTRQAFEAGALRGRFEGLAGEPYLVRIEIQRTAASTARIDPSAVRVEDDAGIALSAPSIVPPAEADPIATLFRPSASIAAGERGSFVLFGREPGAGARLVVGEGWSLTLASRTGDAGVSDLPIARVDRKSPPEKERGR